MIGSVIKILFWNWHFYDWLDGTSPTFKIPFCMMLKGHYGCQCPHLHMSECPPCSEIMIVAAPGRSLHRVRDWAVQMSKQVLEAAARARPRLPAERCSRHRSMPDASKPLLLVPASRFLFMLRSPLPWKRLYLEVWVQQFHKSHVLNELQLIQNMILVNSKLPKTFEIFTQTSDSTK